MEINLLRYKLENNKEALGKGKVVQSLKTNPPVKAKNHSWDASVILSMDPCEHPHQFHHKFQTTLMLKISYIQFLQIVETGFDSLD